MIDSYQVKIWLLLLREVVSMATDIPTTLQTANSRPKCSLPSCTFESRLNEIVGPFFALCRRRAARKIINIKLAQGRLDSQLTA